MNEDRNPAQDDVTLFISKAGYTFHNTEHDPEMSGRAEVIVPVSYVVAVLTNRIVQLTQLDRDRPTASESDIDRRVARGQSSLSTSLSFTGREGALESDHTRPHKVVHFIRWAKMDQSQLSFT
jgi:hypothetical protein